MQESPFAKTFDYFTTGPKHAVNNSRTDNASPKAPRCFPTFDLRPSTLDHIPKDNRDGIAVSIPGSAPKEFYFLEASRDGRTTVVTEKTIVLVAGDGFGSEHFQSQINALPKGNYSFVLIVGSTNNAAIRVLCDLMSNGTNELGFDLRKVIKP